MNYIAELLCSVAKSYKCLTNVTHGGNHPTIVGTASVLLPIAAAWLDLIVCKPPQVPLWLIRFTAPIKKGLGELRLLVSVVISYFVDIVIYHLWFLCLNFRIYICVFINELFRPKWDLKTIRERWYILRKG